MNAFQRGQVALCGNYFKYTPSGASAFKRAGRWHKEPQAGDVVFFYNKSMGRICHVGIVESVNGKALVTIEGNTSSATIDRNGGECRRKTYSNYSVGGNSWIHGFGRPVYTAETCSAEKVLEIAKNEAETLRSTEHGITAVGHLVNRGALNLYHGAFMKRADSRRNHL